MSASPAQTTLPVPTGNTFDKYGSGNPVARRVVGRFQNDLADLVSLARPTSVLDVGCGEGVITQRWARDLPAVQVVGLDVEDPGLRAQWDVRREDNLRFTAGRAEALPFGEGEFDLVAAIESLEHLAHPSRALEEMCRVSARHLLISTPREPIWRALNLVRGAYLGALGNTPGHVQHWSRADLLRLLSGYGQIVAVRSPLPWTMALVRVS